MNVPLVFIHGFLGSRQDWAFALHAQELQEYTSTAVEIEASDSWQSGVSRLASRVPDGAVLIGYSMGARLSLAVAIESQIRLAGIVMVSGSPGIKESARLDRLKRDLAVCDQLEAIGSQARLRQFLKSWYRQPVFASLSPAEVDGLVHERASIDPMRQASLLRTFSVARQPNYWSLLPQVRVPILVLAGGRDPKYADFATRIAAACPNAASQIFDKSGHIVHRDDPRQFLLDIRQFVASVKSSTPTPK